ncbi:formylglycine-generating enzyme family protein [Thermosulfidibacter takaii]|nr:SUMF1/EgtB/PvdO family nonheme iron enzyme [Thermosulfidibacter takaii]
MKKFVLLSILLSCFIAGSFYQASSGTKKWIDSKLGITFVWIPGECFRMGCAQDNPKCYFDEKPLKKICVKGFWISETEVTVEQWQKFLKESGYKPEEKDLWGCEATGKPTFPQDKDHPVVCISSKDAMALANWLSKMNNKKVTLPTEAQWEYVCKTGDTKIDPDHANYWSGFAGQNKRDIYKFTSPVKAFPPNRYGVYGIIGNAWEWTNDWYSFKTNPNQEDRKVIKGGGWETKPKHLRCSIRKAVSPERKYDSIGIRLVINATSN